MKSRNNIELIDTVKSLDLNYIVTSQSTINLFIVDYADNKGYRLDGSSY